MHGKTQGIAITGGLFSGRNQFINHDKCNKEQIRYFRN